jgi:hypothetical protein
MKNIRISEPKSCHLWTAKDLTREEIYSALEEVRVYEDSSHLGRSLKRCKSCGQLYFYEFYEEIDWSGGDDPQYITFIPVEDEESARNLSGLSQLDLLKYRSIRIDFPSGAEKPSMPYRAGKGRPESTGPASGSQE